MDGTGDKFLPGSSLSGDQDAAGLRSDRLNHLKDGPHLGAVADDIVLTGETPQFAAQVASFVLEAECLIHLAHRPSQLVDQVMVLDDVAVGSRINSGNRGFDRGHSRNQQEITRGGKFLAKLQKVHSCGIRHANVGNDDVKNL